MSKPPLVLIVGNNQESLDPLRDVLLIRRFMVTEACTVKDLTLTLLSYEVELGGVIISGFVEENVSKTLDIIRQFRHNGFNKPIIAFGLPDHEERLLDAGCNCHTTMELAMALLATS